MSETWVQRPSTVFTGLGGDVWGRAIPRQTPAQWTFSYSSSCLASLVDPQPREGSTLPLSLLGPQHLPGLGKHLLDKGQEVKKQIKCLKMIPELPRMTSKMLSQVEQSKKPPPEFDFLLTLANFF